jgi:hypothetical protein
MTRKIGFVSVVVMALIVAACGRQVTPNPPGLGAGGALPGFMSITFDVAGQLNFSSYQYWIVFNTAANGQTPSTLPQNNNWAGYSYAIEVGGAAGVGTAANAYQFVRSSNPVVPPQTCPLIVPPTLLQYNANSNGAGTEFTILFSRSIFSGAGCSTAPPSPTPSPTPTATTKPTGSPTASPTPSPAPRIWLFNAFTTQANTQNQWVFIDSMGVGGPTNPQFVSPALNVSQSFDNPYYATFSGAQMDPAAQITQLTLGNNP